MILRASGTGDPPPLDRPESAKTLERTIPQTPPLRADEGIE